MVKINIESNIDDVIDDIDHLGASTKYIKIDILRKVGRGALSAVKKKYKAYLRQPTGRLYKSLSSQVSRKKGTVTIGSFTENYIVSAHENGITIKARRYKYMTYRIGDQWFKTKSVQLKPAPFVAEGGNEYESSGLQKDIDYVVNAAIDKFNKAGI